MTSGPALTPEGEAAWPRMKQHLEWCDSFALVFLFSSQPAATNILRERVAAIDRARVTRLAVPLPPSPHELLEGLLPRRLQPLSYQQALNAPIWLDLARAPAGTNWQQARLQFLARLNEQREPLRRALHRPLVLVLPRAEKSRIKALAPDLWAVRRFSQDIGQWLSSAVEPAPMASTEEAIERFPLDEPEQGLVTEWRRLRAKGLSDRGTLTAGGRAFEALRDLSISLDNLGQIDRALGPHAPPSPRRSRSASGSPRHYPIRSTTRTCPPCSDCD